MQERKHLVYGMQPRKSALSMRPWKGRELGGRKSAQGNRWEFPRQISAENLECFYAVGVLGQILTPGAAVGTWSCGPLGPPQVAGLGTGLSVHRGVSMKVQLCCCMVSFILQGSQGQSGPQKLLVIRPTTPT